MSEDKFISELTSYGLSVNTLNGYVEAVNNTGSKIIVSVRSIDTITVFSGHSIVFDKLETIIAPVHIECNTVEFKREVNCRSTMIIHSSRVQAISFSYFAVSVTDRCETYHGGIENIVLPQDRYPVRRVLHTGNGTLLVNSHKRVCGGVLYKTVKPFYKDPSHAYLFHGEDGSITEGSTPLLALESVITDNIMNEMDIGIITDIAISKKITPPQMRYLKTTRFGKYINPIISNPVSTVELSTVLSLSKRKYSVLCYKVIYVICKSMGKEIE